MAGTRWERNISILIIIRVCYSMLFCISVITLYWKKHGLDLHDFFLLQAIFAVAMVLFEVPTGYIGDRLGRKRTLLLSMAIAAAGWTLYALACSFFQFLLVEIMLGLAYSFLSGTDTAMLFESLKEEGREQEYSRVSGRMLGVMHWAEAFSAMLGGLLATWLAIEWLMIGTTALLAVGMLFGLRLAEPDREVYSHPRGTFYGLYKIARFVFLRSTKVRFVVPLMAACSLATMLGVWLYQPLWQERAVPVWLFGVLWAALSLPAGLASHYAHRWEERLGTRTAVLLLPLPVVLGYLLTALVPGQIGIVFVYLVPLLRGFHYPVLGRFIHQETFSDKRATVMSVVSWLFRLAYFALGPLVGWIGREHGLSWGFITSAAIALLGIGIFLPALFKRLPRWLAEEKQAAGVDPGRKHP